MFCSVLSPQNIKVSKKILSNVQSLERDVNEAHALRIIKTFFRSKKRQSKMSKQKKEEMLRRQRNNQRKSNVSRLFTSHVSICLI